MVTRSLALYFLAACAGPHLATSSANLSEDCYDAARGCFDPSRCGAAPDDGTSDRLAIQSAVDGATAQPDGGTVCLSAGQWDLERAPVGSYNRYAALSTHGQGLTLRCSGPESVLSISGDQGGEATFLFSIDPGAERIAIENCTLRGRGMSATHEQTHAIVTSGVCSGETCRPIRDVAIRNVTCDWPYENPGERKGDCIKLLGNTPDTEVYRVRISDGSLTGARSAIVLQRGLHDVVISGNTLHCDACDQVIDGEATGGGWDFGIAITGNTITAGPAAQGDFDIALVSTDGATITGNTLSRGVTLFRTKAVTMTGNTIRHVARSNAATIGAANTCDGLVVTGNTVQRSGVAGPVVKLESASGVACNGVLVSANILTQGTAQTSIMAAAASKISVVGNQITHTVAAPGFPSIYALSSSTAMPVTALTVANNLIVGPTTYAITLEGSPGSFGLGVSIAGNTAIGTVFGLRVKNASYFSAPIVSSANNLGPGAYTGVTMTAGD